MNYKPENDGIDHINIYSKGKTELGRLMSNFAHTPFVLPESGHFASVEGYWFWLKTGNPKLRQLYGWEAKREGSSLQSNFVLDFDKKD